MLKHIVMLKMKASFSDNDMVVYQKELVMALRSLPKIISEIKFYEVGENFRQSANAFDIVIVSEFNNEKELDIYRNHPEHVKVLGLIKKYVSDVAVNDYFVY